jgi:hypothetical protein
MGSFRVWADTFCLLPCRNNCLNAMPSLCLAVYSPSLLLTGAFPAFALLSPVLLYTFPDLKTGIPSATCTVVVLPSCSFYFSYLLLLCAFYACLLLYYYIVCDGRHSGGTLFSPACLLYIASTIAYTKQPALLHCTCIPAWFPV